MCDFGRRKNTLVKTIPCSIFLCTVYFTGDEMSTVVHINLQNNIAKEAENTPPKGWINLHWRLPLCLLEKMSEGEKGEK